MTRLPDLERLRLLTREGPLSLRPPRPHGRERFLKGPVPLSWLEEAGRCSGKALHLGVVLWFLAGVTGRREMSLGRSELARFGVNRYATSRALAVLEQANLVSVKRLPGRKRIVTLEHRLTRDPGPKTSSSPSDMTSPQRMDNRSASGIDA
jgi:hypothetical protein